MDVDVLFDKLKPLGPWQLTQLCLLVLSQLNAAFHLFSIVIIGYTPQFECVEPKRNGGDTGVWHNSRYASGNSSDLWRNGSDMWLNGRAMWRNGSDMWRNSRAMWRNGSDMWRNDSDIWHNGSDVWRNNTQVDQCSVYNGTTNDTTLCTEWTFHVQSDTSIVSELSQVCSERYKVHLSQTILIVGQAVGAWVFCALSDRYGRRVVMIVTEVGLVGVTFATAFVYDMWLFIALRFLTGACQQGCVATAMVLGSELVQTKYRARAAVGICFGFSVGAAILPLTGYLFRHQSWRHFQMFGSLYTAILIVVHIIMLEESVRWLLARSSTERACAVIKRIRIRNRSSVTDSEILSGIPRENNMDASTDRHALQPPDPGADGDMDEPRVNTLSQIIMFKDATLRKTTILLSFSWVTVAFIFFGVTLMSSTLAGDRYFNFFLSCIVETPAMVAFYFCVQIMGRKRTLYFGFLVCMVAFFVSAAVTMATDMPPGLKTTLWVLGKFGSSLNFSCVFVYTPELYPTKLRSLGLGIESAAARIGGMVAPFTVYLLDVQPWLPSAIFGVTSLVAYLSIIPLPETMHTELPQDMAQLHAMWRRKPHNANNTELHAMSRHQLHNNTVI